MHLGFFSKCFTNFIIVNIINQVNNVPKFTYFIFMIKFVAISDLYLKLPESHLTVSVDL